MDRLPVSQVSNSLFTLGDEDDELQAEDIGTPPAGVGLKDASEHKEQDETGVDSTNGSLHGDFARKATADALKTETMKQPNADTLSSTRPVQQHSNGNGKLHPGLASPEEAATHHSGHPDEGHSSESTSAALRESPVDRRAKEDSMQAVIPPTVSQHDEATDATIEGATLQPSSLLSAQQGHDAAGLPEQAQPSEKQTVSAQAEVQRIADELAALEAEAEALALQEHNQSGSRNIDAGVDLSRYSVSLADDSRCADRAMAEAHQWAEQVSSGASAMQRALDSFEPGARPFSPPPGSAPLQRFSPIGEFVEPPEFQGLLYYDGLDSLGRPVVVINADAVAEEKLARKAAFNYLLHQLEPVVSQGPYVLVMVNTGRSHKSNRLQASWLVSAYRGLSRPFRKNVKFIILVRPSKPLKAFLTMLRPFLSRKAHRKVIKVESLSGIAEATGNEVALQHLGARFAAAAGRSVSDDLSLTSPTLRGGSSPMFSASPH